MATIKNDIIREVFTPSVTITTEEYDRLKAIERQYREFLDNPEAIIIEQGHASIVGWSYTGYSSSAKIINADEAMKIVVDEAKKTQEKLATLRKKKVPIFNPPGTKVMHLD